MGQISAKLRRVAGGYGHWCPACQELHAIAVDAPRENGARWSFDGNVDAPTFSPSVNISAVDYEERPPVVLYRCHYFLTDGRILYCGDCTHDLKGQVVALPDLPPHLQGST